MLQVIVAPVLIVTIEIPLNELCVHFAVKRYFALVVILLPLQTCDSSKQ